jgi:hypothetical protein
MKGTLKEYYRFSDWLGSNLAQVKEDLSDMAAEARHPRISPSPPGTCCARSAARSR